MRAGSTVLCGVVFWVALALGSSADVAARTLYVDADATGTGNGSSWADAYWCLQDALASARSGDEVRVAEGTHRPDETSRVGDRLIRYIQASRSRTATFQLKNGVILKGGYAGFGRPDPDARDVEVYQTTLSNRGNPPALPGDSQGLTYTGVVHQTLGL
jgi:hypothetical protein